mmetsp:Transcript_5496/g.19845  ORF Transcript_5496/g.19845 Transcript_5496/m.19845 type:complete len:349 (+) Transcript_5496:865-1911(+)
MALTATSSSSVTRNPPSPELMSLLDWAEKHAATVPCSEDPDLTPFQSHPREWAQSSMRVMSYFLHTSATPDMSHSLPLMWDTMAILAPDSLAFLSKSSTSMTNWSVQFTYSGSQPACTMAEGTAAKVNALVKILVGPGILDRRSCSFLRTAKTARKMALPHELSATQYLCPVTSAKDFSTRETSSTVWSGLLAPGVRPPYLNILPDSMTSRHLWIPASGTGHGDLMLMASLGSTESLSYTVSLVRADSSTTTFLALVRSSCGTLATKAGLSLVYFLGPEKVNPNCPVFSCILRLSLLSFVPQSLAILAGILSLCRSNRSVEAVGRLLLSLHCRTCTPSCLTVSEPAPP